ncbi:MAG: RecX family transcriptional regulator [Paludibacteraceae bacterium]|nr:RecX family transcriptional regulator [Paludibacteraceae bacterium]
MGRNLGYEEALAKAAALCSLSEKCESDIRKKLLSWGLEANDSEKAIQYLIKEKYIDEKRFARFFVQDKHRFSKWGKTKISYSLKEKGISPAVIREALESIKDEDYSDQIDELLKAKLKGLKYKDLFDAKAKLFRFGMSRGFEYEKVMKAIEHAVANIKQSEE